MRYQIVTLGCPKNTTDSDRIARTLEQQGHRAVQDRVDADLVILNTCGFIDDAREESRQAAEILGAERQRDQQVIVTGCWSQIERDQVIEIDGIDATFGIEAWLGDRRARRSGRGGAGHPGDIDRHWAVGLSEDLGRLRAALHILQHSRDQGSAVPQRAARCVGFRGAGAGSSRGA